MRNYQEKLNDTTSEALQNIIFSQKQIDRVINSLYTMNAYNYIISNEESPQTAAQIKRLYEVKKELYSIYREINEAETVKGV